MTRKKINIKKPFHLQSFLENENFSFQTSRRGFFKYVGFSAAVLALAEACRTKTGNLVSRKIPAGQTPSSTEKKWFASTCSACHANCPVLVKTINNIPVKVEGNAASNLTGGGLCMSGQTILEEIFTQKIFTSPLLNGQKISWEEADKKIISAFNKTAERKGKMVILGPTINSPSTLQLISEFSEKYGNVQYIPVDLFSSHALLKANERCFGKRAIPTYIFEKAKMIVSFGADFLAHWISPVEYTRRYSAGRDIDYKRELSYHVQVEAVMSLTGANADKRIAIKPSEEGIFLLELYNEIAGFAGKSKLRSTKFSGFKTETREIADKLWNERGRSIVIGNSNIPANQMLINGINCLLDNYGRTIDLDNISLQKAGNDEAVIGLANEIMAGKIDAILLSGFRHPLLFPHDMHEQVMKAFKTIPLIILFDDFDVLPGLDDHSIEKSENHFICPSGHFLEEWNDHRQKQGHYSISQPVVPRQNSTRSFQDSLLKWSNLNGNFEDYIRRFWKENIFIDQNEETGFENSWLTLLTSGIYEKPALPLKKYNFDLYLDPEAAQAEKNSIVTGEIEIIIPEQRSLRHSPQLFNPVLIEINDPVNKSCWDDFATISGKTAKSYNLEDGDLIELDLADKPELPVLIQPGQAEGTLAIPFDLCYNPSEVEQLAPNLSRSLFSFQDNSFFYSVSGIKFRKLNRSISTVQIQHDIVDSRDLHFRELTLNEFLEKPLNSDKQPAEFFSVRKKYNTHHWAMVVDLNLCTGCSSCVAGCIIENNIPSVGKKQLVKRREMHWLRIDRYYSKDKNNNLKVSFLPVMCQHCTNAPCEAVCPVAATSSGSEGINQQVYQRCIGSRYCAANCPYQVRKFNFCNYFTEKPFMNFNDVRVNYLNPDVSIREKGIIEKCSMCIQRIQEAKNRAKSTGTALQDGEIKTACSRSCPAQAITFGDLNDKGSRVYSLLESKRAFRLLESLGTEPSVIYLAKVRNE